VNKHCRDESTRGAVIVETALVVGIILTMLLFSVQIGVLGFLQITVDAASFVNARQNALSFTSPNTSTAQIFNQVNGGSDISGVVMAAPSPSIPVDYQYNSTNATAQSSSSQNRHGGAAMMQPTLYQATVQKTGILSLLGRSVGVSGQSLEPFWQECGAHFNVANAAPGCGMASPPPNYQVNYFKKGENTPPYYASMNNVEHCREAQPWTTCSSDNFDFMALGIGEYLHYPNWRITLPGASGLAGATTFQQMACHQRAFAKLANFFYGKKDLIAIYNLYLPAINAEMYDSQGNKRGFNNFAQFAGFDAVTNGAIQQIYSWDRFIQVGYAPATYKEPNEYPLNPSAGC